MINIYKVGGAVRDELLFRKYNDIDYAVEASSYQEMKEYIETNNYTIFVDKPKFFTIRAKNNETKEVFDFVLCRKEANYIDHRHPSKVSVGTIYDDLERRDFTMNAIAKTEDNKYIDPFNGVKDIKNRLIRVVGNTRDKFIQDPLRILRAIRFVVVLDFTLSDNIVNILNDNNVVMLLKYISSERVIVELTKMFKCDSIKSIKIFSKYPLVMKYTFINFFCLLITLKKI